MTLAEEGRALIEALSAEIERPLDARETGADTSDLVWIRGRVDAMVRALTAVGRKPVRGSSNSIGHAVTDTWHLGSELGSRLIAFEQRFHESERNSLGRPEPQGRPE